MAKPTCVRCQWALDPTTPYLFYADGYDFNVTLAQEIVRDGRAWAWVKQYKLAHYVEFAYITEQHLAHVNMIEPGIIAHLNDLPTGELLIDGNHRGTRALRAGFPFGAYHLTVEETRRVMLAQPAMPILGGEVKDELLTIF